MFTVILILTKYDLKNNNILDPSMNRLAMLDSDEDVALIVLVMDYLVRKIRSASRIPELSRPVFLNT